MFITITHAKIITQNTSAERTDVSFKVSIWLQILCLFFNKPPKIISANIIAFIIFRVSSVGLYHKWMAIDQISFSGSLFIRNLRPKRPSSSPF